MPHNDTVREFLDKFNSMSPEEQYAIKVEAGMIPHPETGELLHPMDVKVNYPELMNKPDAADKANETEQGPTSNPDQTMVDISKAFYSRGDVLLKSIRARLWRQGY